RALFDVPNNPAGPAMPPGQNQDRLLFGGHYACGRFSPDGRVLAVVTSDAPEAVRLCDAATGRELRRAGLAARALRLSFTPDGRRIADTERDGAVRAYEVATGKRAWEYAVQLRDPFENFTTAVVVSPDGRTVAAGASDNAVHLLDADTGA